MKAKKAYLVVPNYGTEGCSAYFDRRSKQCQAKLESYRGDADLRTFVEEESSINCLAKAAHEMAVDKGFWDKEANDVSKKLLLIHSEVTEAAEEVRAGNPLEYSNHPDGPLEASAQSTVKPEGLAPELADVLIRTLDLMHGLGIDVEDVVRRKMAYNQTRGPKHEKKF